jgi:DNA-binding CsgD family transcriptional regulator
MQGEFAELIMALREIEACTTHTALWTLLSTRVSRFGASIAMITLGPEIEPFTRDVVTYSELPVAVIARLEADIASRSRNTKRSRLVVRSMDPQLIQKSSRGARSGRAVAWFMALRRIIGADAIFIVPVHRLETVVGIATFAGPAANFDSQTRSSLYVLANAALTHAAAIAGRSAPPAKQAQLSARELACLAHFAKDRTVPDIGRRLGISARTVRFHLDNARTKLAVVTRAQAVRKAIRQGLIAK